MATTKPDAASDLERRKSLRLRLRRDLSIEAQKYEGKTFFVVKDPVSLRYYRLKENEHFLLKFLDGKYTLEDAQKAYEEQYRPERLKLEDLEAFAQQLIKAGLAQNESPKAGKQLFENRKKRKRQEWMQTLTNILYIKIPVIDPDRLLKSMIRYVGWIFSLMFFALSIGVMLGAVLLVATHFDTFRSKLPNYHEFFSFKTVVYLWAALAVVKVIHEFGHGLSCKRFGGEVHEMGLLFLCLSPAMYCNVSDAWTLPSKWHRIIISFAGIYVELVIASLATFVWWNTPSQPFINNLSLSLMVVCSVSTVVFNANPLMRYDGYYVLADWLEIPNLREKANRFLSNLVLEHCLGVEVQPEPYMQLTRRILFVVYAIASYLYKWLVTFTILWFMYNFLRPYKLEVISTMLAFAALVSMFAWPVYRLGKNIYRRGRLPDMKRWRVVMSSTVLLAIIGFLFLVPIPISRVRGTGLVQAYPDATAKVFVRYPGILEKLNAMDGLKVKKGDILAEFSNRELESHIDSLRTEVDINQTKVDNLIRQRENTSDLVKRGEISLEINQVAGERDKAATEMRGLLKIKQEELVLVAPRSGIISGAPRLDDIHKTFEKDPTRAFLTITEPGRLRICLPVVTQEFNQLKENSEHGSALAQSAFYALNHKRVTVHFQKASLQEVLEELTKQVPAVRFSEDRYEGIVHGGKEQGISSNANKQHLSEVLDKVLTPLGLGYVVLSLEGDPRDGMLSIREGRERGHPEGERIVVNLPVTIRVQGHDSQTWKGRLLRLPESEAKEIPLALSNRANGPVAVKGGQKTQTLVPQTQHYLVYVDVENPDLAISPGSMAQVKVHCKPETVARWVWRKINALFDLGLM
jgi:putative peptide zinc metalloprotease protein